MKNVLREYGRTIALFSAAGFLLSLLVGLLARNPFGTMLLRALLLGVLFAGFGAGVQWVVRRFLPELSNGEAGVVKPNVEPEAGPTIDIVLPEERPPAPSRSSPDDDAMEPAEASPAAALEELAGAEEDGASEPAASLSARAGSRHGPVGAREGIDTLEDIGSIASEAGERPARNTRRFARSTSAAPTDAARSLLEDEDPAELARAVRTVLKREERT